MATSVVRLINHGANNMRCCIEKRAVDAAAERLASDSPLKELTFSVRKPLEFFGIENARLGSEEV
ncbi:MAG: hypothetical protein ACRD2A_23205 [Vicinamibacterales bacterium]